jgi:hypothetical protein
MVVKAAPTLTAASTSLEDIQQIMETAQALLNTILADRRK